MRRGDAWQMMEMLWGFITKREGGGTEFFDATERPGPGSGCGDTAEDLGEAVIGICGRHQLPRCVVPAGGEIIGGISMWCW